MSVEAGVEEQVDDVAPPQVDTVEDTSSDEGPGSGRSQLRRQLEQGFDNDRKAAEREAKRQAGRFNRTKTAVPDDQQKTEAAPAGEGGEAEGDAAENAATPAPEAWTKEAKAAWGNLPPEVQAAVTKREVDMAKGVEELKAKYTDLDKVLAPRLETIRRHGQTPANAVNQLWLWFEALSQNPDQAFPALAQSFKYDLRRVMPQEQPQQQQVQPQAQQQAPSQQEIDELPAWARQYFGQYDQSMNQMAQFFQQKLGSLEQNLAAASQAKTDEILSTWAKDKPHFEDVRQHMANLIGSGAVPPLPNGSADLDKAYDMALWGMPEVRQKILAEQAAAQQAELKKKADAERKAQQELAEKARRAATSIAPTAPGAPVAQQKKGKTGKSVRESIMEARQELSE